jgi:O-antigen/teichoic acid export membrane protein
MTSTARIARNGLWITGSFLAGRVLALLTQVIMARILVPADFGLWAMVLLLTTLSALFRESAIAQVLIQRGLEDKKIVDAVYSLGVNISLGLCLFQGLAGWPLSLFFNAPVLWPLTALAGVSFLVAAGAGSHGAILERQLRFKALAMSIAGSSVATFVGTLGAALLGWGVWSFACGVVLGAAVDGLLKRYFSGYQFNYQMRPDPEAINAVRSFVTGVVGINLAVQVNTNGDNLVIGKLLGAETLGFYNVAYQLAMVPVFALSQLNRVNFSVLARHDDEGKKQYISRSLGLYALLAAPLYGLAFVIAPWIIPLCYGANWVQTVPIFQLILGFGYARGMMAILGTCLNALGKPGSNAAINWALVPISIPAYIAGAYWGGSLGVALAVVFVMGVGATVWFGVASCRAANWPLVTVINPVALPSVVMGLSLLSIQWMAWQLQPMAFIALYGALIHLCSRGELTNMLVETLGKSLHEKLSH